MFTVDDTRYEARLGRSSLCGNFDLISDVCKLADVPERVAHSEEAFVSTFLHQKAGLTSSEFNPQL